jgi:predicted phage-related endonuclease
VDYQLSNRKAGMDCKTSRTGEDWGREGTDEVPSAYIVQCQHYMAVTGFDLWYVAVLIGGSDFRVYEIRSDHELQEWMRERLLEWWNEHIVYGRRPPMDSSEGTRRWLRHRFPHDSGLMIPADAAANMAAVDLWRARAEKKQLEDDERKLEHYLYEQIGDASGIEGAGWRATWKRARDTKKTDWEAVARSLMTEVELFVASLSINGEKCVSDERIIQLREEMRQAHEQLIERNTSMREGSRRFLFRWAEEESE